LQPTAPTGDLRRILYGQDGREAARRNFAQSIIAAPKVDADIVHTGLRALWNASIQRPIGILERRWGTPPQIHQVESKTGEGVAVAVRERRFVLLAPNPERAAVIHQVETGLEVRRCLFQARSVQLAIF